jgi:8-hydroxy-5-deazaflavin:NADPH oxidoreductase
MKIGILGGGTVGSALGKGLAKAGHQIIYSSREPGSDKIKALLAATGNGAQAGTIAETIAAGEVVINALRPDAALEVANADYDWSGKILMDACNRFPVKSPAIAQEIAHRIPDARVVKAFNSIGAELMSQPDFGGEKPTMFICGDDAQAKSVITGLTEGMGFEVIDVGDLSRAGLVESLAELWVTLAYHTGYGRNIAFRLLRK